MIGGNRPAATPTIATPEQPDKPEQQARRVIDDNLRAAGWQVQSADRMDISAAPGVAVAEVPMSRRVGTPDYTLYVDREKVGIVEAKAHGTLSGAEAQSARYAAGVKQNWEVREPRPRYAPALRYRFESNGHKTYFTDSSDPIPRSREVFNFPRPQTLAELSAQPAATLRSRLQRLPALDESRLWAVQGRAINALEASFARADERVLIQMATGAGKTFTAVNVVYRLLKHAGAKRVLFLVDRNNLRTTFCCRFVLLSARQTLRQRLAASDGALQPFSRATRCLRSSCCTRYVDSPTHSMPKERALRSKPYQAALCGDSAFRSLHAQSSFESSSAWKTSSPIWMLASRPWNAAERSCTATAPPC